MAAAVDVSAVLEQSNERQCVRTRLPFSAGSGPPPRGDVGHSGLTIPLLTYRKAISVSKEIPVDIDLGLLAAFDPNPIDLETYQFVPLLRSLFDR